MEFPDPVISIAIEPKTKADQEKLGGALQRLATEDPSFRVVTDPETGQTLISGMGELHLEIIVDRLLREFKVDANVGKPQVAYKETIRKAVEHETQVHPPDRWPRPVRPRRAEARAGEAGRGLRVRRRHQGRRHPARVHPGDREGREGGDGVRRARRLPGRRREGHGHLRLLPRRRLVGDGVQDRRLHGLQGGDGEGVAGDPRADHGARGGHARGLHRRRDQRHQPASRPHRRAGAAGQHPGDHRHGAARGDVRIRDRSPVAHQGRATFTMQFSHYEPVPKGIGPEALRQGGRLAAASQAG